MDALVGGEVQGTFSRSPGFGLALPRAQADQASGEDLADLGQALGGGHAVGIESVAHPEVTQEKSFVLLITYRNGARTVGTCRRGPGRLHHRINNIA